MDSLSCGDCTGYLRIYVLPDIDTVGGTSGVVEKVVISCIVDGSLVVVGSFTWIKYYKFK